MKDFSSNYILYLVQVAFIENNLFLSGLTNQFTLKGLQNYNLINFITFISHCFFTYKRKNTKGQKYMLAN